jgi:ubiquilin
MGAPPSEEQMAEMLSDPAMAQMMNEALNNPQMIDLMIQSNPTLRQMGPQAREVLQSPMFRQMMTNPDMLRQAAAMRRMMGGGGASAFPAPGATDTTPEGAAASSPTPGQPNSPPINPFGPFGMPGAAGGAAGNPFAALFNPAAFGTPGHTPAQSPPPTTSAGQATPAQPQGAQGAQGGAAIPPNPFASMFAPPGGAGASPFAGMTPEMMQQALALLGGGGMGSDPFGAGGFSPFGGAGSPPPPADTRPPEELYADQLRQLNDMGFFDFDRNVQALRRSGGSVQGAINQLLGS